MNNKVAYPGTFNPWHNGHQYVYDRLCEMFGKENVFVMVASNPSKGTDSLEIYRRAGAICEGANIPGSNIIATTKTVAESCKSRGIDYIARGIRSGHDATNEFTMADWNLEFGISTVFIYCGAELKKLSSSALRELDSFGTSIAPYVPEGIYRIWELNKKR